MTALDLALREALERRAERRLPLWEVESIADLPFPEVAACCAAFHEILLQRCFYGPRRSAAWRAHLRSLEHIAQLYAVPKTQLRAALSQGRAPAPPALLREPITAWRVWRVGPDGQLMSLFMSDSRDSYLPWPTSPEHASCPAPHQAPDPACRCGWHGCRSFDDAVRAAAEAVWRDGASQFALAVGTVSLWGRAIEHEDGWRAEHAYPRAVYAIDSSLAPMVARRYRIEAYPAATLPAPQQDMLRRALNVPAATAESGGP
jgi:hypothetical protein